MPKTSKSLSRQNKQFLHQLPESLYSRIFNFTPQTVGHQNQEPVSPETTVHQKQQLFLQHRFTPKAFTLEEFYTTSLYTRSSFH